MRKCPDRTYAHKFHYIKVSDSETKEILCPYQYDQEGNKMKVLTLEEEFNKWLQAAYPTAQEVDLENIKQVFYAGALIGYHKGLVSDQKVWNDLKENLLNIAKGLNERASDRQGKTN